MTVGPIEPAYPFTGYTTFGAFIDLCEALSDSYYSAYVGRFTFL